MTTASSSERDSADRDTEGALLPSEADGRRGARSAPRIDLLVRRPQRTAILLLVVLVCTGLRLIHLEADTPINVGTGSMGLYIDEGYKTLAARNAVLFGASRWHPDDLYPGWGRVSGLTHWPYVASFGLFGVELGSARLVSIGYFLIFLSLYAFAGSGERSVVHLLAGLLLLSVSYVLFFYSRAALLEVPLVTLCYGALFALRCRPMRRPGWALSLLVVSSAVATFQVKRSALLYFLPIFFGYGVATALTGKRVRFLKVWGPAALAFVLLVAYLTRTAWTWRIDPSPAASFLRKILLNPMTTSRTTTADSSVLLVCLGLLCALHLLALRPRRVLADPYRGALLGLALLTPVLMTAFTYTPLRYYVAVMPAYVLVFLEWCALRPWTWRGPSDSWLAHALGLPLLAAVIFLGALAFDELVLYNLPLAIGNTPGISSTALYRFFLPVAAVAAVVLWPFRGRPLTGRIVPAAVAVLLLATVARDLWVVGRFLAAPSYRSREIARSLEEIVGPTASIAGDIAPFFALGTGMHALLVAPHSNSLDVNTDLEFDYFQFSETNEGRAMLEVLESRPEVSVGPALYRSEYAGRAISLHRLHWDGSGGETSAPQLEGGR